MPHNQILERLLGLAGFNGTAADAFRALREHFAPHWPDIALALLFVDESDPTQCLLAGLTAPDGTPILNGQDARSRTARLPRFGDALAARCAAGSLPINIDLAPNERGGPLAEALLSPASLLVLPVDDRSTAGYRLAFASTVRHRFDLVDIPSLWREARLAFAILSAGFLESLVKHENQSIESLADIQRLLQPDRPSIRGMEYAAHWQPASTAAGDYYDVMSLSHAIDDFVDQGNDAWGVTIADVSGHGAAAAMEAVQFDAILRTYQGNEPPGGPAGALTYANRHFFSRRQRPHYLTAFTCGARPDIGGIRYVCAGHLPALHRRGNRISWLGRGDDAGIPLGILREHRWTNVDFEWQTGDLLLLFTDGFSEARNKRGQMFGQERLAQLASEGVARPQDILDRIRDALFEHQDGELGADDQTLLVLQQVG